MRPMSTPLETQAATGEKTSRPWKVWLTVSWKYAGFSTDTIRRTGSRSMTAVSTPLSGAMKVWTSVSTARMRRSVPTPGSTTTTWTVSLGKNR